ncbi:MAG: class I SAM-dependent methyltransferase [Miltoncostaeaceae bacterium]
MRAGWPRLFVHSWRLGLGWLARSARRRRFTHARQGLYRMLVPLEPWRYWEMGHVARAVFEGRWLDVGSPKLLASTLQAEGRGEWTAIDLFAAEIERWRDFDPELDLRVQDARKLDLPDHSFDGCACISVIEHIPAGGDLAAMEEMWRVLRPGGLLWLTTNVAPTGSELLVDEHIYGEASEAAGDRVFFERRYTAETLRERLLGPDWQVLREEYVVERLPVHRLFFAAGPWSFALGNLLALVCPWNVRRIDGPEAVPAGRHGVVSLLLRKPEDEVSAAVLEEFVIVGEETTAGDGAEAVRR